MKNLIKLILLLGVIVYLVFAFTRFNKPNEKDTCQAVNIVITDSAQAPAGCHRLQQPRMMSGDHEALPAKSVHPGQTLQSAAVPVREGQRQQGLAPPHAGRRTGSQYQSVMVHDLLSSLPPLRGCVTRNPCPAYSMRPSTGPRRGNGLPQAQGPSSRLAMSPVR